MTAGMEIKVDTRLAEKMIKTLAKKFYDNPRTFYTAIEQQYYVERKQAIQSRGASLGYRWAPLHIEYVKSKRKHGKNAWPWSLTGRTEKALTGGRGGGRRTRKSKKKMTIGVGDYPGFYDKKHGTTHPFYILNYNRPIQGDQPTHHEMEKFDRAITRAIYKIDKKVSKKGGRRR